MAESDNYKGPYTTINEDVWPQCRLEDFYLFKTKDQYHIICEDNVGGISGHERWGVHLFSADGKSNWKIYEPTVVYDHEIKFDDGTSLHCVRRERPQLLIRNRKITHLATGVYDGKDSWCQPVELVHPVRIINRK